MPLDDILQGLEDQKKRIEANLSKLQDKTPQITTAPDKDIPSYQPHVKREIPMKMTANQIAIMALREQGLNNADTARELGVSKSYVTAIDKKVNGKYSLSDTRMVKAAHKAVKSLLAGEPFGSITEVKDSTSLQAAKMVYDRIEPLKTINESNNLHTFIEVKIDLEQYKKATVVKAIDVTPSKGITV